MKNSNSTFFGDFPTPRRTFLLEFWIINPPFSSIDTFQVSLTLSVPIWLVIRHYDPRRNSHCAFQYKKQFFQNFEEPAAWEDLRLWHSTNEWQSARTLLICQDLWKISQSSVWRMDSLERKWGMSQLGISSLHCTSIGAQFIYLGMHTGAKIHVLSKISHIENPNFYKIHLSEISFFTKFTFLKYQSQGNCWIKSGFLPQCDT